MKKKFINKKLSPSALQTEQYIKNREKRLLFHHSCKRLFHNTQSSPNYIVLFIYFLFLTDNVQILFFYW